MTVLPRRSAREPIPGWTKSWSMLPSPPITMTTSAPAVSTMATALSAAAWATSKAPAARPSRRAWELGVNSSSTRTPFFSNRPFAWPAKIGRFWTPGKTRTRSGTGSAARAGPAARAAATRAAASVARRSRGRMASASGPRACRGVQLAGPGERAGRRPVPGAGHDQGLGREAGQDLVPGLGHQDLLLDPRRRPAVRGRPEILQREDHARLERHRVLERHQPAHDRLLPDREPDAVAVLEAEARLLVGEAELLGPRPGGHDVGRRDAGLDHRDGDVQQLPAALVGVHHGVGGAAHREGAVVAGAVAHVGVEDVEVGGVPRAQHPVGEDVGVGVAALAGD